MSCVPCILLSTFVRRNSKPITANLFIVFFLISYTLIGGFIFLHFEHGYANYVKMNDTLTKRNCIESLLRRNRTLRGVNDNDFARTLTESCLSERENDPRLEWSYKTAALYGFGILTTLGYGKVEPQTHNGRIFTVIYGFIGIPMTVILLTNIGRYLEILTQNIRNLCSKKQRREKTEMDTMTGSMLFIVVIIYLILGAIFVPLLQGNFDFFNGIYFAFICLTAIEYGDLVPENNWYIPIIIVYVCVGLAISTIALDIGSLYVRKLHYIGRKLKNIANIRIWFGSRNLEVQELISAVGQNIGIDRNIMADIDIEALVETAIQVKLGRLARVPQTHMIVEGIWPPELVPLFMKDGQFPLYVDSEEDLLDLKPKKSVVRFEDEIDSDADDTTISETPTALHSSRLSPMPPRVPDHSSRSRSEQSVTPPTVPIGQRSSSSSGEATPTHDNTTEFSWQSDS